MLTTDIPQWDLHPISCDVHTCDKAGVEWVFRPPAPSDVLGKMYCFCERHRDEYGLRSDLGMRRDPTILAAEMKAIIPELREIERKLR